MKGNVNARLQKARQGVIDDYNRFLSRMTHDQLVQHAREFVGTKTHAQVAADLRQLGKSEGYARQVADIIFETTPDALPDLGDAKDAKSATKSRREPR